MPLLRYAIVGLVCVLSHSWALAAEIHHDLEVYLDPGTAGIEVRDSLTLPDDHPSTFTFELHPGLKIERHSDNAEITPLPAETDGPHPGANRASGMVPRRYRARLDSGQHRLTLYYSGVISHELQSRGEEYARSFKETEGIISEQGVFLSAASAWYPRSEAGLINFDLTVHLPAAWRSMSQGELVDAAVSDTGYSERWRVVTPQEEIYLIAGSFKAWSSSEDGVTAMVLLRSDDAALAQKYLDATHQYIALYDALIGPYPFKKFAMVENFWETGYGMPSFTLLGSRVIRFPFILSSSYPHEILHNWWGNGVYVDYDSGNWSEGLTSYLADHLIKEQLGGGTGYRRNTLQNYTDYVGKQVDFPLTAFRSRHSARTEAVGYGKTLMLFHMLRLQLGDEVFKQGLQAFYRQYRFRVAGFTDLQSSFSTVAGRPLDDFFRQWVDRTGAPGLRVGSARAEREGSSFRLTAVIEQVQSGPVYQLDVPVAVHMDGVATAYQTSVALRHKRQTVELKLPARPLQFDVDPEFDVFRRLHRGEIPPAISQAVGAEQVMLVLPEKASPALKQAYRTLAERWRAARPGQVEVMEDTSLKALPADKAVWLFGWDNRLRPRLTTALGDYDFVQGQEGVHVAGTLLKHGEHSLVVMARRPDAPHGALGWIVAESAAAVEGLGRKLPHYGRYSYLGFTGTEPDNMFKGQWPVVDSPMSMPVEQADGTAVTFSPATLAPRKALVPLVTRFSSERMREDVAFLTDSEQAGRALGTAGLDRAADYIARQFRAAGLQPGGEDGGYFQAWQQEVGDKAVPTPMKNVIAVLPGNDPRYAGQSLVIGAHYDHLGLGEHSARREDRGKLHPGADDNASGIAVLLEVARGLDAVPLPRTLVFVAFAGEESGLLGSRHYVRSSSGYPVEHCIAMLNLDTVGRLGGNPLTLFAADSADEWVHIFRGAGYVAGVDVQPVSGDFGSSDQTAFIEAGIPAVQLFSGSHEDFHRPGDTPDKLDYPGMIRVARVLDESVRYLAQRAEPLSSTLVGQAPDRSAKLPSARRVSFGTVPDFAYAGEGVRLDDVRAGTPAQQAGLRKGDVIIAVNDSRVSDLRAYSAVLKGLAPGDEIHVRFLRAGTEMQVSARVVER